MIKFINNNKEKPFLLFKEKYESALKAGQKNIDAISISSYNIEKREVDSRYVNLKYIDNENFIFFTNYESPKANAFKQNNQIAGLFFWGSINTQIRIKAKIKKTTKSYNDAYFKSRSKSKNALAISSTQSHPISNFNKVVEKYNKVMALEDLSVCPKYWGGYSFKPYEIEFWLGNTNRLNKRDLFKKNAGGWNHFILEP